MAAFQENHNRICPILENPASDNPILDFPIPDYPTSENPMQLNKDILNTPSFPFHIPNPSPFGGNQPLRTNFTKKHRSCCRVCFRFSIKAIFTSSRMSRLIVCIFGNIIIKIIKDTSFVSLHILRFDSDVPRGGKINIPKIFFSQKRQQDFPIYPCFSCFFCFRWYTA